MTALFMGVLLWAAQDTISPASPPVFWLPPQAGMRPEHLHWPPFLPAGPAGPRRTGWKSARRVLRLPAEVDTGVGHTAPDDHPLVALVAGSGPSGDGLAFSSSRYPFLCFTPSCDWRRAAHGAGGLHRRRRHAPADGRAEPHRHSHPDALGAEPFRFRLVAIRERPGAVGRVGDGRGGLRGSLDGGESAEVVKGGGKERCRRRQSRSTH